ncbi:MAG: transglutaminase domain-containing protein [Eubacteriales bacterium]|nr:transglutaminase domain-containing protein [Eubacteriales bacterium]
MSKPAFLQKEALARLGVAFLLTVGLVLPLLFALGLEAYALNMTLLSLGLLVLFTVMVTSRRRRMLLGVLTGVALAAQFFLPNAGLLGGWLEAFKAFALYFSGYTIVLPLYGAQAAGLLTVLAAALSFLFSKRGVGFLPAALLAVLMMFALWSLGKGELFWYAAPALVALLLMMSQSAHEKINLLHVLPMALAAVVLAFLLVPSGRIALEPLSTAASNLKQTITDYLFFTDARDVFTLGTYGYYPMGNNQLGGAAQPTEYPVMMVKTDRKTLLRAVVKDWYDGRAFSDTSSAKRYLYINPRWQTQRRKAFLESMPGDAILKVSNLLDQKAISVQMENSAASTVFTPVFLRSLTMENDMVPYFNDSSELFITRDLALGDRYTVYAPVFEGGDSGLDALVNAPLKEDAYYSELYETYTQLPSHLEQKVFDDVRNIVAGETTPYGKAMAIMRHLQKYYRYTLTPDTPPQNKDFITYFLYVGREGYCTYYAAAMTVMCRMVGLPARYVEGFLAQPSGDGFAYVTGKDAHAWTEVYFEGFGWVPFDPTPLQEGNTDTPQQNQSSTEPTPSPEPSAEQAPTPTPDPDQDQNDDQEPTPSPEPSTPPQDQNNETPDTTPSEEDSNPFQWPLLLLAAALGALVLRMVFTSPDRVAARKATEKEKTFVYGAAVQQLLIVGHHKPKPGETPLAYARRIDGVHVFPTPIMPLWRILALSNYSRLEPGVEQTQRAREIYRKGCHGTKLSRRIRFRLGAAFNRRFYRVLDTAAPHGKPPEKFSFKPPKPTGKADASAYAGKGRKTGENETSATTPKPGRTARTGNAPKAGKRDQNAKRKPKGTPARRETRPSEKRESQATPPPQNRAENGERYTAQEPRAAERASGQNRPVNGENGERQPRSPAPTPNRQPGGENGLTAYRDEPPRAGREPNAPETLTPNRQPYGETRDANLPTDQSDGRRGRSIRHDQREHRDRP